MKNLITLLTFLCSVLLTVSCSNNSSNEDQAIVTQNTTNQDSGKNAKILKELKEHIAKLTEYEQQIEELEAQKRILDSTYSENKTAEDEEKLRNLEELIAKKTEELNQIVTKTAPVSRYNCSLGSSDLNRLVSIPGNGSTMGVTIGGDEPVMWRIPQNDINELQSMGSDVIVMIGHKSSSDTGLSIMMGAEHPNSTDLAPKITGHIYERFKPLKTKSYYDDSGVRQMAIDYLFSECISKK